MTEPNRALPDGGAPLRVRHRSFLKALRRQTGPDAWRVKLLSARRASTSAQYHIPKPPSVNAAAA
jgi:hypothetical protein